MEGFDWTAGGLILIYRYLQEWYIVDYGNGLIVESNAGPHSNSSILIVFLCQATVHGPVLYSYITKKLFSHTRSLPWRHLELKLAVKHSHYAQTLYCQRIAVDVGTTLTTPTLKMCLRI